MIKSHTVRLYLGVVYHLVAVVALVQLGIRRQEGLPLVGAGLLLVGTVVAVLVLRREQADRRGNRSRRRARMRASLP